MVKSLTIVLDTGQAVNWNLDFSDQGTLQLRLFPLRTRLQWTELDFCKCPACALDREENPTCPVADVLSQYARDLADHQSFERVKVHITQEDGRHVILESVPLQNVVGELVRIAVFQSACPVGRTVKPAMSRLRLFPSNEEILQELAMHFAFVSKGPRDSLDEDQLRYMQSLHELFGCLSRRLEHAGQGDVYLNAVVVMHSLSLLFSLSAPELLQKAIAAGRAG